MQEKIYNFIRNQVLKHCNFAFVNETDLGVTFNISVKEVRAVIDRLVEAGKIKTLRTNSQFNLVVTILD